MGVLIVRLGSALRIAKLRTFLKKLANRLLRHTAPRVFNIINARQGKKNVHQPTGLPPGLFLPWSARRIE